MNKGVRLSSARSSSVLYCFVLAIAGGIGAEGFVDSGVVELGLGGNGDIELSMAAVMP